MKGVRHRFIPLPGLAVAEASGWRFGPVHSFHCLLFLMSKLHGDDGK